MGNEKGRPIHILQRLSLQLRLFERMRCRVDPADKAYKCYRLECIQNQILRTKILPAEIRVFRDQGGNT